MTRPAPAPVRTTRALRALCRVAIALVAVAPLAADAQGMSGHPMPPGPRSLHLLLAQSDAVAIGTVDAIENGRLRVRDAVEVAGAPGARFEVKVGPSNPPNFAVGSRGLFLLRGARPPYVLSDDPREQITILDPSAEARWGAALRTLWAARGEPTRERDVYLAWCDGDADDLREVGLRALFDPDAGFHPLPPELSAARAHVALDPTRPLGVRKAAAGVAILVPEGTKALVAGAPSGGPADDSGRASVYEIALQGALLRRDTDGLEAALRRGLAHPDTQVRRVAARFGLQLALPEVRAAVAKLTSDPDPEVRESAAKAASGR